MSTPCDVVYISGMLLVFLKEHLSQQVTYLLIQHVTHMAAGLAILPLMNMFLLWKVWEG